MMKHCAGAILAGGRGQRFGGRDKGLLRLHGEPLAARAAAHLAPQVHELHVSIARHRSRFRALGLRPIVDETPDHAGPLAGLARILAQVRTPYLVILPCDSPDIPNDYVQLLWQALRVRGADICIVRGSDGVHPLHALMKTGLRTSLMQYLADGGGAARQWVMQQRWTSVRLEVMNINRPAELRACTITRQAARAMSQSGAPGAPRIRRAAI